ncbi:MAG TPA: hypothetical protein VLG25_03440 [Patescibacteria group bacterium]|nr:hypothetical protein [Patescibacteria group bacterium]
MNVKSESLRLKVFAWSLSAVVVILAFLAWGMGNKWQLAHISNYKLFPLFGLIAFSLMWAHYIVSGTRQYFKIASSEVRGYFEVTSFAVFLAILFHPGLLWWQLWRDGLGLPPESYLKHYVAPGLGWVALLGTASWFVFLAYEFRRLFDQKSWWHYVQAASDIAIVAVFYHALRLGTQLRHGWLKPVWYFYGVSLLIALGYIYYAKRQQKAGKV